MHAVWFIAADLQLVARQRYLFLGDFFLLSISGAFQPGGRGGRGGGRGGGGGNKPGKGRGN